MAAFVPSSARPGGSPSPATTRGPLALAAEDVDRRLAARGIVGRYYDGETHRHIFALPKDVRVAIEERSDVITDATPLILTS